MRNGLLVGGCLTLSVLLAGIVIVSLRRSRRVRKELQDIETKVKSNG